MDNYRLIKLIRLFKDGNTAVFSPLFLNFEKLIKMYASRLDSEDTFQELILFLIELFKKIDLSPFEGKNDNGLNRYIAVALKHEYIRLSKIYDKAKKESSQYYEDTNCLYVEFNENTLLSEALSILTPKQRKTVIYKYIYNLSDREIGAALNISRQAVNKTKSRAIDTLKGYYSGEF